MFIRRLPKCPVTGLCSWHMCFSLNGYTVIPVISRCFVTFYLCFAEWRGLSNPQAKSENNNAQINPISDLKMSWLCCRYCRFVGTVLLLQVGVIGSGSLDPDQAFVCFVEPRFAMHDNAVSKATNLTPWLLHPRFSPATVALLQLSCAPALSGRDHDPQYHGSETWMLGSVLESASDPGCPKLLQKYHMESKMTYQAGTHRITFAV